MVPIEDTFGQIKEAFGTEDVSLPGPDILLAKSTTESMPTSHRGLPLPAAMELPQPKQTAPAFGQSLFSQPPAQTPAPPQRLQGAEDPNRNWLEAKAEEDKLRQEEEKTRQEGLRLELRKVEQEMLRTSLSGGIPPHMIPLVFTGMGGANPNLVNTTLGWAQHYIAQAHQLQQEQLQQQQHYQRQQQAIGPHPHSSPELRRESRQVGQIYGQSQHPIPVPLLSTPIGPGSQQPAGFLPSYPMSPGRSRSQLPGPATLSRPPPSSELPRLNTGEMHIHQLPQGPPGQLSHLLHQPQSANPSQQESHSIYFHHWQPPISQASTSGDNQLSTPIADPQIISSPYMYVADVLASSPRKRKAQGPQQAAPPPSSQGQHASPPFSHGGSSSDTPSGRRRGHSRQRSDLSSPGMESYGRPSSRHRHSESPVSTLSGVSPTQQQGFETATPEGTSSDQSALHRFRRSESLVSTLSGVSPTQLQGFETATPKGTSSDRSALHRFRRSESLVSTLSGVSPTPQQGYETATPEGTSSDRSALHRLSASKRSNTRQSQGSEMRQEDGDSADQES